MKEEAEVARARAQRRRIPKQLTAEETRTIILQYDVVKQAEKGLVEMAQALEENRRVWTI